MNQMVQGMNYATYQVDGVGDTTGRSSATAQQTLHTESAMWLRCYRFRAAGLRVQESPRARSTDSPTGRYRPAGQGLGHGIADTGKQNLGISEHGQARDENRTATKEARLAARRPDVRSQRIPWPMKSG